MLSLSDANLMMSTGYKQTEGDWESVVLYAITHAKTTCGWCLEGYVEDLLALFMNTLSSSYYYTPSYSSTRDPSMVHRPAAYLISSHGWMAHGLSHDDAAEQILGQASYVDSLPRHIIF